MRIRFAGLLTLIIAVISACAPATEFEDHTGHITVENQVAISDSGYVFMFITNNHDEPVTLTSATSDAADSIEFNLPTSGLEIPGGKTLDLSSAGNFLKLINPKKELIPGSQITITLAFSDGHTVDVLTPVKISN